MTAMNTLREQSSRRYSLLIFDWDGTLMDSSARIVACMHKAADSVGLAHAPAATIRNVIGLSLEVAVPRLFPGLSAVQYQTMITEFRRQSLGKELAGAQLFAGVDAALRELAAAGYQLAVATGKSRRGLDQDLRELGFSDLFPITRTADETFSKPHPLMLEQILTDYDLRATDALMIGDTEYDLQMAANAGMDALAVTCGAHSLQRLLTLQVVAVLDDCTQLPAWLEKEGQ